MTTLSEYAAMMAQMQELPLPEDYRAGVEAHLAAAFRLARLVLEFELDDDVEPAPVFRP